MKYILSSGGREVLCQLAWSNVLLAFDYDGTLAPIVREPDRAAMRRMTRALLGDLADLYPCIVISGRAQADALRHLRGIGVREVVGNHGIEPGHTPDAFREAVQHWQPVLERQLASFKGVQIEDKVFSLAIHYRRSREKKRARAAILKAAAGLGKVSIIGGKQVVNILPRGAPHKGIALECERARLNCDTAIYVGDDETDEDVFALEQPGQLLTIRVGLNRESAASYYLRTQAEIDVLLRVLIEYRRDGQHNKARP